MILAGDIGGTNTRIAFVKEENGRFTIAVEKTFASRENPSLETVLRKFLAEHQGKVTLSCFGIAGPVLNGRCEATNLPWVVDARKVARILKLRHVGLINDLEANAYGIDVLDSKDFVVLNRGSLNRRGNRAVISAGTGLGEAGMYWDDTRHRPFASEGGHSDFAPRNHLEIALLEFLLERFSRVSFERVVSGPGLLNIYQFLRDTGRAEEPAWLAEHMRHHDQPAVISKMAIEKKSPLCEQALDLFVSLYGSEAGNFALKIMATGGIYIGGGIAPKILPKLKDPLFMNAFVAKGRLKPLLQAMPVRIIVNPKTALLGAANCAIIESRSGASRSK